MVGLYRLPRDLVHVACLPDPAIQPAIFQHVPGVTSPPDFYFMGAEMVDGTKVTTRGSGDLVYLYTEESKGPSELCGKTWVETHVIDRT